MYLGGIVRNCIRLYDNGGIDSVWDYLIPLVWNGTIDDETAEAIANMIKEGT